MHIAVCDDEKNVRTLIRKLINRQMNDCRISEFSAGEELLRFQEQEKENPIDLLFLGVAMEKMDGITTAKRLREQKKKSGEAIWGSLPLIIFVTDYPDYMPDAFSVSAFQYILKPVREPEFEKVFAQAVREYRYLGNRKMAVSKEIFVKINNTVRTVPAEEVCYIESNSRKVILHLPDQNIEYYDKISELEILLRPEFFRVHRGYLVNMKYVERYDRKELRMKNGDSILISKYKYTDFVKAYLKYISEG